MFIDEFSNKNIQPFMLHTHFISFFFFFLLFKIVKRQESKLSYINEFNAIEKVFAQPPPIIILIENRYIKEEGIF